MQARSSVTVVGERADVYDAVADLCTWPRWVPVVPSAVADGDGASWRVRLGLAIGPVRLGFDVRMRRVVAEAALGHVRFERDEGDGREHSAVVVDVTVAVDGQPPGTVAVTLDLLVDKRLPLVDLQHELERRRATTTARLQAVVDAAARGEPTA